jgi:hypothetical protein
MTNVSESSHKLSVCSHQTLRMLPLIFFRGLAYSGLQGFMTLRSV